MLNVAATQENLRRICQTCGADLPVGCSPRRCYCDGCKEKQAVARVARWREDHPDKAAELRKREAPGGRVRASQWYANNTERVQASSKAWREAHPDLMAAYHAKWFSNPANVLKARSWVSAWMQAHPEKVRVYYRKWYVENAVALREVRRFRRSIYTAGSFTFADWQTTLEVFSHCCAYCLRDDLPLTMDHLIPISRGGEHTVSNVVPACRSCNSRKNDRPLILMAGNRQHRRQDEQAS